MTRDSRDSLSAEQTCSLRGSCAEASAVLSRCLCLLMSPQLEIPHGHGGRGRALEIHEGQQGCSEGWGGRITPKEVQEGNNKGTCMRST